MDLNMIEMTLLRMKWGIKDFFTKENGEVNVVAIVVLCGIAVVLALVFKEEMTKLLRDLINSIKTSATEAVKPD